MCPALHLTMHARRTRLARGRLESALAVAARRAATVDDIPTDRGRSR